MLKMPEAIISDTSCLIVLSKIGELDLLLKMYGHVMTTVEVSTEYGDMIPDWIKIKNASNKFSQQILQINLGKGEASAIALALEIPDSIIILDDFKARKVANQLGLTITGTIGIIVKAKLKGIIPSIIPLLAKIAATDFRISKDLEIQALKEAGELQ